MPYTMLKYVRSANILYHYICCELSTFLVLVLESYLSYGCFFVLWDHKIGPLWKSKRRIERRQIKLDLVMAHQGQCSGQVSLNLANLDFQGLTRFLNPYRLLFRPLIVCFGYQWLRHFEPEHAALVKLGSKRIYVSVSVKHNCTRFYGIDRWSLPWLKIVNE